MFPKIMGKGIIQPNKFHFFIFFAEQGTTGVDALRNVFRRRELRLVVFLVTVSGDFFTDAVHAAQVSEMPTGIPDGFISGVSHFLRARKIAEAHHPCSVPRDG